MEERSLEHRHQLALSSVCDDGLRAISKRVAGTSGAQAEVRVLGDVLVRGIEPADRLEDLAAHQQVRCRSPPLRNPVALLEAPQPLEALDGIRRLTCRDVNPTRDERSLLRTARQRLEPARLSKAVGVDERE